MLKASRFMVVSPCSHCLIFRVKCFKIEIVSNKSFWRNMLAGQLNESFLNPLRTIRQMANLTELCPKRLPDVVASLWCH